MISVLSSVLSSRIAFLLTINDSGWAPYHNFKIFWVGGKGWIMGVYGQRLFRFCEFRFFIHKQLTTPNSYCFSEQVKCILRMRENVFTIYSPPPTRYEPGCWWGLKRKYSKEALRGVPSWKRSLWPSHTRGLRADHPSESHRWNTQLTGQLSLFYYFIIMIPMSLRIS